MHSFNIQDDRSTCFPSTTNFKNAGVSIKIEVASRFKYSNRLYQRGAGSLIFPRASGGMLPQKIIKFQSTSRRSLAFRDQNEYKEACFPFKKIWRKLQVESVLIYRPHAQSTLTSNEQMIIIKLRTFAREQILFLLWGNKVADFSEQR